MNKFTKILALGTALTLALASVSVSAAGTQVTTSAQDTQVTQPVPGSCEAILKEFSEIMDKSFTPEMLVNGMQMEFTCTEKDPQPTSLGNAVGSLILQGDKFSFSMRPDKNLIIHGDVDVLPQYQMLDMYGDVTKGICYINLFGLKVKVTNPELAIATVTETATEQTTTPSNTKRSVVTRGNLVKTTAETSTDATTENPFKALIMSVGQEAKLEVVDTRTKKYTLSLTTNAMPENGIKTPGQSMFDTTVAPVTETTTETTTSHSLLSGLTSNPFDITDSSDIYQVIATVTDELVTKFEIYGKNGNTVVIDVVRAPEGTVFTVDLPTDIENYKDINETELVFGGTIDELPSVTEPIIDDKGAIGYKEVMTDAQ